MIERLSARVIAIIVGVALLLIVAAFFLHQWQNARTNAARARLSTNQAQAGAENAKDAVNVVAGAGEREAGILNQTEKSDAAIRAAKGADASVDPGVRDAGLRSLCARPSYHGNAVCLRLADPGAVENAGPRR